MKYLSIFYLLIVSTSLLSCKGQTSENVTSIEPKAFAEKIKETPNAQIIDVRTAPEFAGSHIDTAVNIDWLGDAFVSNTEKLDKTKPIFVYCKTGNRSQSAAAKLEKLGFKTIYELKGGLLQWDAQGFSKPIEKTIGISSAEYAKILDTDKKVLIDFYAEWCAPCKKMTPYLLQMQKDLAGEVIVIRLNADENKTLITAMKIVELPTLLMYEKKELKWKHSGFISEEDLKKQLQ